MTWGDIVEDVLITCGYNHDDALRNVPNGMFSLGMILDRLKKQRIEKDLMSGFGSKGSTYSVTIFNNVPVTLEPGLNNRAYFNLPSDVYDIQMNGGIEYITYNRTSGCQDNLVGRHFTLTSPAEVDNLAGSAMQAPSEYTPYYFRARYRNGTTTFADRVWLIGISPLVKTVEIGIYMTLGPIEQLNPDDPADIPADMVYLIKRHMLDMERWILLTPQQRLQNDGRDFKPGEQPLQPPQMVSVNDPTLTTN